MVDVLITGGEVVDGTGSARRRADIAITGDRITEIGALEGATADTVIDATGKVVTPGFVDVHTHLDAQVFWDTTLSPSPLHGVTSVIGGNCGFTIAPLSDNPADGDYLMRMLARVEGMPLATLQQGVPWNWKSTEEYFASFDKTLSINAGFKIGHSALRRVVMGDDANKRESTADELAAMKDLLRLGLEAGGIGFSSSWSRTHNDADSAMVPSRYASRDEMIQLCSVLADFDGTSLEFIPCVGPFEDWATDLMADMSVAAQSPLNWNVLNVTARTLDEARAKLEAGDIAADRGGKVVALTVPLTLSLRLNFDGGFILDAFPEWEDVMLLPKAEKMAVLADPEQRRRLDELAQSDHPLRNVANWRNKVLFHTTLDDFKPYLGRTIGELADDQGKAPFDTIVDMALEEDLQTSFGNVAASETQADWDARAEIWQDPRAVIGASDAGAHLDLFLSAQYATTMLASVRDHNTLPFEEAIHQLTQVPARLYGLKDRGVLTDGAYADIVVLDEATVASEDITVRADLPADASRLYAGATGIHNVICNGQEIVRGTAFTEARPGSLLRSGEQTTGTNLD